MKAEWRPKQTTKAAGSEPAPLTLATALEQGIQLLSNGGIPVPRLTSEVLLCHALQRDRAYLYAHSTDELTELTWIHYGRYLHERLSGKPTQYITHRQEFYGRDFYVSQDVLIPRPETEHLVEAGLNEIVRSAPDLILDIGTGSGAIAISLALESQRTVLACDISTAALAIAERNRCSHNAAVLFFTGDLASAVRPNSIDLLISNPPYVPASDKSVIQAEVRDWEPEVALYGGDSGNEIYARLIVQAAEAVRSGGHLMMEMGYRSLPAIWPMLEGDWTDISVIKDLAGLPRVITAKRR
jgi:release factor glutamine methyltransferase